MPSAWGMASRATALRRRLIARVAMVTGVLLAGCGASGVAHRVSPSSTRSTAAIAGVLSESWKGYTQTFVQSDGRVIDPMRGGLTTSEGQSYALLRAVWMNDRATFDRVWRWTAANLQVRGDGLLAASWRAGAVQDRNSASDADTDTALALLFAARRFATPEYLADARQVLQGVWEHDVTSLNGMNMLTAGSWAAQQSPGPVLNPSYFAPYAYRIFAREEGAHPWLTLVDSTYVLLARCTGATLDGTPSAALPPNWCAIDRSSNAVVSFAQIPNANDYGYDAFRVMWRVAVDATWNGEARARAYLLASSFLREAWDRDHRLDPVYGHNGTVLSGYTDLTVYGGDIGNFLVAAPTIAAQVQAELLASFHPGPPASFGASQNYYEQNWAWFGLALSGGQLVNLDAGPP